MCLFRSFIFIFRPFIFISLFHRIVSLNLISRYMSSTSEKLLKSQDLLALCKFLYNQVILQCIRSSCSVHTAGRVKICLYVCVNVLAPACSVFVCLCVWYQIRVLEKNVMRFQPSVNLMPCCLKHSKVLLVLRYQGSTSLGS